MRVVITGGSGFIGRSFLDQLSSNKNHSIYVLSFSDITLLKSTYPEFTFIKIAENLITIEEIMDSIKPNVLVHLGWKGIPDYSLKNSIDSMNWSILITKVAISSGVCKVIGVGSCWEYLEPVGSISEDWPIDTSNAFKLAKFGAREFMTLMCKDESVEFIWLRLFYVYGRHQNKHSLIPQLMQQASVGVAPMANNPEPYLDFVSADYVARVLERMLEQQKINGIYNVGSGSPTGIIEIVNQIRNLTGYPPVEMMNKKIDKIFYSENKKLAGLEELKVPNVLDDLPIMLKHKGLSK